jgi:threonine dehydrogenase-like Zn-dependent dehydrogenase
MGPNVFHGVNDIRVERTPRPRPAAGEAVIRVTLTTICGTDLHILRGEYPVRPVLVIGHEPVGVINELGEGVIGYKVGDRVLVERPTVHVLRATVIDGTVLTARCCRAGGARGRNVVTPSRTG